MKFDDRDPVALKMALRSQGRKLERSVKLLTDIWAATAKYCDEAGYKPTNPARCGGESLAKKTFDLVSEYTEDAMERNRGAEELKADLMVDIGVKDGSIVRFPGGDKK